jgi:hypothetical protein
VHFGRGGLMNPTEVVGFVFGERFEVWERGAFSEL